ncbi:MAG: hypothetical protein Q4D43_10250, partial [Clostridia bacterium]|nr:hypothetical protein [Clostridia bacterium]
RIIHQNSALSIHTEQNSQTTNTAENHAPNWNCTCVKPPDFNYLPFGRRMSKIFARTHTGASSTVLEFQAFFAEHSVPIQLSD